MFVCLTCSVLRQYSEEVESTSDNEVLYNMLVISDITYIHVCPLQMCIYNLMAHFYVYLYGCEVYV